MNSNKKHEISLQTAIEMTQRFRSAKPIHMPSSETFEMEAVQKLLDTHGCALLRIYYGRKENGDIHAILVAADPENNDILPPPDPAHAEEDNEIVIIEDGYRCPTLCPPDSPLNV